MRKKIEQGTLVVVTKGQDKYLEGAVVKVLSYNSPEKEYMVTKILESKATHTNPNIMENEETGFKMTKEEFDTNEFIHESFIRKINYKRKNIFVRFLEFVKII